MLGVWRRCSACKKDLNLGEYYYVCSIASCNKKSRPTQYCSPSCWDAHNAVERHKDAGAMRERAPTTPDSSQVRVIKDPNLSSVAGPAETDILVVVSKVKKYVDDRVGFNTSSEVMPILTDAIKTIMDAAIDHARREGRKTVLDRDIPTIRTS